MTLIQDLPKVPDEAKMRALFDAEMTDAEDGPDDDEIEDPDEDEEGDDLDDDGDEEE